MSLIQPAISLSGYAAVRLADFRAELEAYKLASVINASSSGCCRFCFWWLPGGGAPRAMLMRGLKSMLGILIFGVANAGVVYAAVQ